MKEQIEKLMNRASRCMDINTKANDLLVNKDFSVFKEAELYTIAELSANEAIKARRDARGIVASCEKELEEMRAVIEADKAEDEEKTIIVNEVLEKIKAEFMDRYPKNYAGEPEMGGRSCVFSLNEILRIIDKYKMEKQ